jgi:transcription antitermination factor NusG
VSILARRLDATEPAAVTLEQLRAARPPGVLLRWTCVRTYPQAERWAEQNLSHAGYETYLPLVRVKRRDRVVRSLWHSAHAPLFSGYVFLRHDPASSWAPIREAPGVRGLIKAGNRIEYTSDVAVAAVRASLEASEGFAAIRPPGGRLWAPGVPCSPRTGPFRGHPAVVLQVGVGKALVSLLLFGALREVMISLDQLVAREA